MKNKSVFIFVLAFLAVIGCIILCVDPTSKNLGPSQSAPATPTSVGSSTPQNLDQSGLPHKVPRDSSPGELPSTTGAAPPPMPALTNLYGDFKKTASGGVWVLPHYRGVPISDSFLVYVSAAPVWPYDSLEPTNSPATAIHGSVITGTEFQGLPEFDVYAGRRGRCFIPRRGRSELSLMVAVPGYALKAQNHVGTHPDGDPPAHVEVPLDFAGGPRIEGRVVVPPHLRSQDLLLQWSALPPNAPARTRIVDGPRLRSPGQQFHQSFMHAVGVAEDGSYHIDPVLVTSMGVLRVFVGDCLVEEIRNLQTSPGSVTTVPTIRLPELRITKISLSVAGMPMRSYSVRAAGCPLVAANQWLLGNDSLIFSDGEGQATAAFIPTSEVSLLFQVDEGRLLRIGASGYAPLQDPLVWDACRVVNCLLALMRVHVGARPNSDIQHPDLGSLPISVPWNRDGTVRVELSLETLRLNLTHPTVAEALSRLRHSFSQSHGAPDFLTAAARKCLDDSDPASLLRAILSDE